MKLLPSSRQDWAAEYLLLQPFPHLGGKLARTGSDAFFVHADDLFIAHQDLAATDRGIHGGIHQSKEEMAQEIIFIERGGWLVIKDSHIRWGPFSQFAHADSKLALNDFGIVLQEQLWHLCEADARVAFIETVEQVAVSQLSQHI